jgi:hypothetical protein
MNRVQPPCTGARENLVGMVGEQAVDVSPLPEGTPYTLI